MKKAFEFGDMSVKFDHTVIVETRTNLPQRITPMKKLTRSLIMISVIPTIFLHDLKSTNHIWMT